MSRNTAPVSEKQNVLHECAKVEANIIKFFINELEMILPKETKQQIQLDKFIESFKKIIYGSLSGFIKIQSDEEAAQANIHVRTNIYNLTNNLFNQLHPLLKAKIGDPKDFEQNIKRLRENFGSFFPYLTQQIINVQHHSGRKEETSSLYKIAEQDGRLFILNDKTPDPLLFLAPMGKVLQTIKCCDQRPSSYEQIINSHKSTLIEATFFYLAFTRICFKTHYRALQLLEKAIFPHLFPARDDQFYIEKLAKMTRSERIAFELEEDHLNPYTITKNTQGTYDKAFPMEPFTEKFSAYSPFQLFTAYNAETKTFQHDKPIERKRIALSPKDLKTINEIEKLLMEIGSSKNPDKFQTELERCELRLKETENETEKQMLANQVKKLSKEVMEAKQTIKSFDEEAARLIRQLSPEVDPFSITNYMDDSSKHGIHMLTVYGSEFRKARMPAETPKAVVLNLFQ